MMRDPDEPAADAPASEVEAYAARKLAREGGKASADTAHHYAAQARESLKFAAALKEQRRHRKDDDAPA